MEILRIKEVCRLLKIGRTTLDRWRQDPEFPRPVKLGPKAVGFLRCDIEEWLEARKERVA